MDIIEFKTQEAIFANYPLLRQLYDYLTEQEYQQRLMQMIPAGYRQAGIMEGGQCVAAIGFRPITYLFSGQCFYIDDLIVHEDHRHQHYGTMLLEWAEKEAARLKCRYTLADSFVDTPPAHHMYFAEGFKISAFNFLKEPSQRGN